MLNFSFLLCLLDASLGTFEANKVIALRLQILLRGGAEAEAEASLMVSEKMEIFAQAVSGIARGSSYVEVYETMRSVIHDNYGRLSDRTHS
jgi:hypothetical protein